MWSTYVLILYICFRSYKKKKTTKNNIAWVVLSPLFCIYTQQIWHAKKKKKKKGKKEEVKTCIGLDYFTMAEQNREWG